MKATHNYYKLERDLYVECWNYAVDGFVNWFRWDKKKRTFNFGLFTVNEKKEISFYRAELTDNAQPISEDEYRLLYKEFNFYCMREYLSMAKYRRLEEQWESYWSSFKSTVIEHTETYEAALALEAKMKRHLNRRLKPLSELLKQA